MPALHNLMEYYGDMDIDLEEWVASEYSILRLLGLPHSSALEYTAQCMLGMSERPIGHHRFTIEAILRSTHRESCEPAVEDQILSAIYPPRIETYDQLVEISDRIYGEERIPLFDDEVYDRLEQRKIK